MMMGCRSMHAIWGRSFENKCKQGSYTRKSLNKVELKCKKGTKVSYKMGVPLLILIVFHLCVICVCVCHNHDLNVYLKGKIKIVIIIESYIIQNTFLLF